MLIVLLGCLALSGVSLIVFNRRHNTCVPVPSAYSAAPADWPDMPVSTLGVFRREGRINQSVVRRSSPEVPRLSSFDEARDFVLRHVKPGSRQLPAIALRLSPDMGPDWADVLIENAVIARVPTGVLALQPVP